MKTNALATVALGIAGAVTLLLPAGPAHAQAPMMTASAVGVTHEGNVLYPQLSPDGTQIAYEVNYPAEKRTELWMVGWSGRSKSGNAIQLVPETVGKSHRYGQGKRIVHEFAWAHTGDFSYSYTISDASGNQDIYIDNWSQMVSTPGSANKNSTWDPKGSRFVFSSGRTGNGDLYMWDAGDELQLTFDDQNGELYPQFDHLGEKVAFVRAGKSGSHIYVLDVNLFSAVPLVQFSGADSTRPVFSPDGSKVAFFSNRGNSSVLDFSLWITPAQPGGSPSKIGKLVRLPSKGGAAWTPDGKGLVAVKNDADAGDPLCIYPIDGGAPTCLATGTKNNRDPQLREIDGSWRLLYTAQDAAGDTEKTWKKMYVYDIPR
jgi:Tol biopolymer transport system component